MFVVKVAKKIHQKIIRSKALKAYAKQIDSEQIKAFGKLPDNRILNEDKIFWIIYREVNDIGFGSQIGVALHQIEYAINNGYIPLIQRVMTNGDNNRNQWEICFEQLTNYSLSEVYKSKNVLFCLNKNSPIGYFYDFWKCPKEVLEYYRSIYAQYIKLNDEMKNSISNFWDNNVSESDRVLGVLLRGTDYNETVAFGHPVQPSIDMAIKHISQNMKEYDCNKLFIATEDEDILRKVETKFGEKCFYVEQKRFSREDKKTIIRMINETETDKEMMLKMYITAIYVLAMCNGIVVGNTSASNLLPLINDKFEFMYRFDLGVYADGDLNEIIR